MKRLVVLISLLGTFGYGQAAAPTNAPARAAPSQAGPHWRHLKPYNWETPRIDVWLQGP